MHRRIGYKTNEMFKAKYGRDLDDTSARSVQGFLVLADAINRAGSTEAVKIEKAWRETDLKPEQLMIGYRGVKSTRPGRIRSRQPASSSCKARNTNRYRRIARAPSLPGR